MAQLSVSLLGPFQACLDGRPISDFQSNRVRALLAYLAAEADRQHPRNSLAGLLWPDYPNTSALAYLRNALANLRQVFGDSQADLPFLLVSRETLQLNPKANVQIDLREFETLVGAPSHSESAIGGIESAVALVRGPFLEGFTCDSADFEEWALTWRERTNRQHQDALRLLAGEYAQAGQYEQSIRTARKLLELEPWDEAAHCMVIQGLAQEGRRGAALAQYETCRRVLRQELAVEPSLETRSMVECIRNEALSHSSSPVIQVEKPHLPTPLTSFIGRQQELAEIFSLLCHPDPGELVPDNPARLLTLHGAGGCGKTRLAIAAAHKLIDTHYFTHGVSWVDFSVTSNPALAASTIAAAFGMVESPQNLVQQQLLNYLREKQLLLVLDTCEHLVEGVAPLVKELLEECPNLQILATSRQPLGVPGEVLWRVPSMTFPDPASRMPMSQSQLCRYDAIRLFDERARAASPRWQLENNAETVVAICNRLDGIPLAIELAATRVHMLTVEQIASHLDDAFGLLTGGSRTALLRHQTLHACIDWSYTQLLPDEQALLRKLSVFNGGWTLEAVEAVGKSCDPQEATQESILDLLSSLVDHSLVVVREVKGQGMRYRLLDTVRQYAHEKLVKAGEKTAACRCHLAFFLDLTLRAEAELRGPDQVLWLDLLMADLDNIRAALNWSVRNDPQSAMRIAAALHYFWRNRALKYEGLEWIERALDADRVASKQDDRTNSQHTLSRGWALISAIEHLTSILIGRFTDVVFPTKSQQQSALLRCENYIKEGSELFRELGRQGYRGLVQMDGWANNSTDYQQKKALIYAWLSVFRDEDDTFYMAFVLQWLSDDAMGSNDYELAKHALDEEMALRKNIGDLDGLAYVYYKKALIALHQKDLSTAEEHLQWAMNLYRRIGILEYIWWTNYYMTAIYIQRQEFKKALLYSEQTMALARETGADWQIGYAYLGMGAAILDTDPSQAYEHIKRALIIFENTRNQSGMAAGIEFRAFLSIAQHQFEIAARLLGSAMYWYKLPKRYGAIDTSGLFLRESYLNKLRSMMDQRAFGIAWAKGEEMSLEQAVAYALEELGESGAAGPGPSGDS